jgi:hypothetical protein
MNLNETIGIASGAVVVGGAAAAVLKRSWWRTKNLHRRFTKWRRSGLMEVIALTMDEKLAQQDKRSVVVAEALEKRLVRDKDVLHEEMTEVLKLVKNEMSYNSGSSIKDAVRRIDSRTFETSSQVSGIDGKIEGIISRLDAGTERARVVEGRIDRIEEEAHRPHAVVTEAAVTVSQTTSPGT